jgi:EAL domain-containing protein (putative c-di-GMP-specific phosphodiesterase class I)
MANTLLESEFVTRKIKQLPFLMLDISETFLSLNLGKNNPLIAALNREFKLSLSHFGAGKSSTTAVYDNLFSCIRLDKHFIHALSKRASFLPFMQSIIDNFRPHCDRMIICGVDDEMLLDKVSQLSNVHLQGTLFPVVKSDAFETLIYSEQFLHTP